MKRKTLVVDPLKGSMLKGMIWFALPIMGTAFLQVLFTSVDTMVMGRFGSENAMASVGASAAIINLIISGVSGLGTGLSILIGQKTGQGDGPGIARLRHSILLTGLAIGAAVVLLVLPFSRTLLTWVHCPDSLMAKANTYFCIYLLSLPFMLTFTFFSSYLHARGNSFLPFLVQVSCGALNLVLNILFVVGFRMDVAGVAVATVISQAVGVLAVFLYFVRQDEENRIEWRKLTIGTGFGTVFRIGLPSSLESIVMNLSGVVMQSAINGFPETVISGNTVAASVEGLMCVGFIGFSSASMVFVSQNYAAGYLHRAGKAQLYSTLTALLLGELLGIGIYAASGWLTGLYTDSAAIAQAARQRMLFMCLPYGLCGTMNVLSGCIRGLGNTKVPLVISILCSCVFRIVWIYMYAIPRGTVQAIYFSYPVCWLLATTMYIVSFHVLLSGIRRRAEKEETAEAEGAMLE